MMWVTGRPNKRRTGSAGSRRRAARRSGAFTLVELLVAALISAILMVGVLNVVSHLSRDQGRLSAGLDACDTPDRLADLIRLDLARAAALTPAGPATGLAIDGYGEIGPETLAPTGRPARVVYRVADLAGGRWLVRQQWGEDAGSPRQPWTEPLSMAVERFSVTPAGPDVRPPSADERPRPVRVPACVRLQIEWSDGRPPLDRYLVLR